VKPILPAGGQIEVRLRHGHTITVTHRPDHGDHRVTVMLMDKHIEQPRHFADEQQARNHANHLVKAYRRSSTEEFTFTVKSLVAA
jgi:hypothetical protein